MHNDVIVSINKLMGYLLHDSKSVMLDTNRCPNILEYAIKYGGYERYIQTIYGAVKQAYIGRNVNLEFDIKVKSKDENNKIVYKNNRADIAYVSYGKDDRYSCIYDIEELKCYTCTNPNSFYEQYRNDIIKIASSKADGHITLRFGHAVGFIAKIMSPEEQNNYETINPLIDIIQHTYDIANYTVYSLQLPCNVQELCQIGCTATCKIGNVAFCAVVTTLYIDNTGMPPVLYDGM